MKRILIDEDIKRVWENLKVLTIDNVDNFIAVKSISMSNGYIAALSLDVLSEDVSMYHLSVSNPKGKVSVVTAQKMAFEILGEGYTVFTIGKLSGCHQFIKLKEHKRKERVKEERVKEERVKEERVKEERVKEERVKEERVKEERGKNKVEGEIKNGIERGFKKKI